MPEGLQPSFVYPKHRRTPRHIGFVDTVDRDIAVGDKVAESIETDTVAENAAAGDKAAANTEAEFDIVFAPPLLF
jgi:hypothetical protein